MTSKTTSQWNNKNCHKFWSRHDFVLQFFKKSYILKVFQLKNKIICFSGVQDLFKIKIKRSSLPEVFCKKGVLKDFAKFTGKHLCQSLFITACNFIKKEALAQVFSCEFCKNSKNIFFTDSAASRCILVPFELYGRPKNYGQKVLVKLFPYLFHIKTKWNIVYIYLKTISFQET